MLPIAAGEDIAADARAAIAQLRPEVVIVDCMLPAAIAAARSMGRPTVSLVHLLYGPARTQMLRDGGWTTDLGCLNATHQALGLAPAGDGLAAWEAPELVLVTAPRWFDIPSSSRPTSPTPGRSASVARGRLRLSSVSTPPLTGGEIQSSTLGSSR
jgi:hypothetical protein